MKFVHFRSQEGPPSESNWGALHQAATVAFEEIPHDDGSVTIVGAVARCAWGDNFCKRIGRTIAEGRYRKYGPAFEENLEAGYTLQDVLTVLEESFHPDMGVVCRD